MKKLQCKVCGSTRIKKVNDSLCECGVCGRQYSLEEAQQLITEIAETLSPQQQAEKEAALQSAGQYMAAGDTESALQNYETVLRMEPENEEALQAATQIFAANNARDENGEVNAPEEPEDQPEEQPEEQPGEEETQAEARENRPEEEGRQGAEEKAADDAANDAKGAKSGGEKAKKGKTKKTKEKGKTSKKTEKEKEKDHDTDRDLDIHRDHDIDINRDRDIDLGRDKKVVVEKEKKVKEKGEKKGGRGKTAIIIIIVAAVCVIAGIIIGVVVSNSSSAEEETVVYVEEGETAAEETTRAAASESSNEGTVSETEETTTAETAGDAEGTTAAAGMITGMSAAEFADYLKNEAGLDIFELGGEPEVSDEVTLYYYGANIHIEKSKGVKAHDSSVMLYIYESNDTGQVIILRVYAYESDLGNGLDAINDTIMFPVSEAFSTLDLKTYGNEKGQEDYETFRTELNEVYENSAFDGKAYNIADLTFVFEEQEDIAAITLCNMYDLAALYNN